jgi:hypothetical protein
VVRRLLVAAVGTLLAVLAGCGDDESASPPTTDRHAVVGVTPPSPTTTRAGGDTSVGAAAEILRIEAPSEIDCTGATVDVEISYATRNLDAVAFAVDGASVTGPPAPASGVHTVPVPCDGRVHTVMLIGTGPDGPVFATEAIVTRPT